MTQRTQHPTSPLGPHQRAVTNALTRLARSNVMARIWDKDHTVWKDDPTEITDRLGWLTISRDMTEHVSDLRSFAEEVRATRESGTLSCLAWAAAAWGRRCCGSASAARTGLPRPHRARLHRSCASGNRHALHRPRALALHRLLEVRRHDRAELVLQALPHHRGERGRSGAYRAGTSSPSRTPAHRWTALGASDGFRRVFENPPDLGGRYSVGSFFGLVPAALCGMDCGKLLDRISQMAARCEAGAGVRNNPGGWLGAALGALTLQGRDKLTLVASREVASFGLWVEQLIAESTGKDGQGHRPGRQRAAARSGRIQRRPPLRAHAALRQRQRRGRRGAGAYHATPAIPSSRWRWMTCTTSARSSSAGRWQPRLPGTCSASSPFDQPNVQQAKDVTNQRPRDVRE